MLEAAVMVWLLFGIFAAVLASGKGRSGCGWFILGFLLGPIGLLLSWLASDKRPASSHGHMSPEQCKRCPFCAELILREAVKCRYCGSDLAQ